MKLADIVHAPLWFAHVDMTRLGAEGHENGGADPEGDLRGFGGAVHQVLQLRELLKQALRIEPEDIRGITIFGASSSGVDACFLLKGELDGVRMGMAIERFSTKTGNVRHEYTLHGGLKLLGEEWYFSRLGADELAAANTRAALKKLLLNRHKKIADLDKRWRIDASTKREMAEASVVLAFNMEAIQRDLKLESSLSNLIKTVSLLGSQDDTGGIATQLTLQARDADAIKVIAPEIQALITLLRVYQEGELASDQAAKQANDCWSRAQIEVAESHLTIRMQGSSNEMIQSLQKLEMLLPKQGN